MKAVKEKIPAQLDAIEDRFVDLWRTMSSLWGVSPTMAQIHGLLFITGKALSMDEIMERLAISRGNVSMNLSKLVEWGLVRRVHRRGDRREYFESLQDIWEMFTLVAAQRKRREIDPIVNTLRRFQDELAPYNRHDPNHAKVKDCLSRINDLCAFLTLMDSLAQRFFESHRSLRTAVNLLSSEKT